MDRHGQMRKADWDAVGAVEDGVVTNLEALAARYGDFAGAASGQSACFEQWATEVSGDKEVLGWLADLPEDKQQPNLVFAAVRWHGVPAPGAYQALRDALINDKGDIRSTIMKRSTQTNEVGRLATLMPAFATVASESQPLALLEVGASAGLCLYPDRYDYDWRPVGRLTGSGGPELRCDVTGPMALPIAPIDVRWRGGIDLNPLELTDDDAMAWLSILVWPEQIDRRERLVDAIIIARQDPPQLVAGNLLDLLPTQIHAASEHGQVVVFHSAVIAYLDDQDRRTFSTLMRGLVDDGACRWVSNEAEDVLPDITRTAPSVRQDALHFILGVDGQAVARTHQHGAAMIWLERAALT
jgi:hypothetical protein